MHFSVALLRSSMPLRQISYCWIKAERIPQTCTATFLLLGGRGIGRDDVERKFSCVLL